MALCKSQQHQKLLKSLLFKPLLFLKPVLQKSNFHLISYIYHGTVVYRPWKGNSHFHEKHKYFVLHSFLLYYFLKINSYKRISQYSSPNVLCKVVDKKYLHGSLYETRSVGFEIRPWIRSAHLSNLTHQATEPANYPNSEAAIDENADVKVKRKKLKGKRAVVRWLKYFRYKKKKDFERMTIEEKILYKLKKARNKETRLVESLKKIEPPESAEATHDPEILTPEEHFYFLKMGLKCKNYVPVGRRGIFQGVILNMHLHWKKHQTLLVVVKTFTPEEVKEIAAELARLSGGIVLDIHEENTIIMYRGKNYSQPPTEIMSPKITLSRKKALDKSKYRDGLRALRRFIPRLEQDLELLKSQAIRKEEINPEVTAMKGHETEIRSSSSSSSSNYESLSNHWMNNSDNDRVRKMIAGNEEELYERESSMESSDVMSDSEALSDIFETDTEGEEAEDEKKAEKRPLYLDEFDKFPTECDGEAEDFEEHLRQISANSKNKFEATDKNMELPDLDEVDRMFLRAGSLLRRKRR